ncbi:MAG: RsmB/NOP family class I SAM-dependent RNA methyltransferase [Saprospiraceae bacterium]
MKLYPNLVKAVVEALQDIFQQGYYADRVIERLLKSNRQWGSRDRAFLAESVYEMVRWYRLLYEVKGQQPVNEADWLRLFGIWWIIRGEQLPDWEAFRTLPSNIIIEKYQSVQGIRKIRESIPDWLDELGEQELGENWEPTIHALNEPAPVILRANRLKTSVSELIPQLKKEGVLATALLEDALLVTERKNLFATQAFKEGLFEVQDYSSQQVAPFLDVLPGMRVIDACAGGGGKTLHLAALLQNKGQLISMDVEERKLEELRKRTRRAGISIVETRLIDSTKVIKRLAGSADRVLLDVPCSGLGVLRRNPDAKWKLTPAFLDKVRQTQQDILQSYSRMVKLGGKLVYATCSILPSENQQQVQHFLTEKQGAFELIKERQILPQEQGFDGFYMALLERKG